MITENWNRFLDKFSPKQKDIYFTEEYHKINALEDEHAEAFVYKEGNKILVFPFLTREWITQDGIEIKDFETAYGYGGPISNTSDKDFIGRALKSFQTEALEAGYIAGFVRFHPMIENYKKFETIGTLIYDRKTVAIDLSKELDDIWMSEIHTKNRNVIKKGSKEGLKFTADYNFDYIDRFRELYYSTMDKLHAENFYYFNNEYFENFKNFFPNSFIGCVKYNDEIIAGAIFFYDGIYGHYHLAGSDINKLNLFPNNFLLWEAAKELKSHGVKRFLLGGGINSDESNSLFQFKQKFSKSTNDFYIGKLIFNQERYDNICKDWKLRNPDKIKIYGNRLLKYRY